MIVGESLVELATQIFGSIDRSCIGDISVDVHLGNDFALELRPPSFARVVNVYNNEQYYSKHQVVADGEYFFLPENGFVQAITKEHFTMPNDVTGYFWVKSRLARAGFDHSAATLIQPGWQGNLVLEIKNNLQFSEQILIPGKPIGQVTFVKHEPVRGYQGQFNNQSSI